MRIAEALRLGEERLRAAGVREAALDAEALLRHVAGCDRATLLTRDREVLSEAAESRFRSLIEQRGQRRPLQHLTGTQAFWRHEFLVTPDVLIPRPETELVVEASLEVLRGTQAPVIVDVGTGSGCIALSLAAERPDAAVHAVDVSAAALEVARQNAQRLGVEARVQFHAGRWLEPVAHIAGRVDLVASNPPYVDAAEIEGLEPEVRDHEPRSALVPSGDRYSIYRLLAPAARHVLRPGAALVLEVGAGMAEQVAAICRSAGFEIRRILPDLQSIPRAVVACYRAETLSP